RSHDECFERRRAQRIADAEAHRHARATVKPEHLFMRPGRNNFYVETCPVRHAFDSYCHVRIVRGIDSDRQVPFTQRTSTKLQGAQSHQASSGPVLVALERNDAARGSRPRLHQASHLLNIKTARHRKYWQHAPAETVIERELHVTPAFSRVIVSDREQLFNPVLMFG